MRLQTFAGLNNIAKSIENHDMLILTWKELFWEKGQCCYSMYGMLGRHHYTILRALHQGICLYAIFSNQNWPNFKISTDFRVCWCCLPNELLLFGSIWEINYDKLVGRMMFYDIYDVLKLLRDINIAGIALENSCPGLWCQDVNVPSGGPRTSFSVDASSRCAIWSLRDSIRNSNTMTYSYNMLQETRFNGTSKADQAAKLEQSFSKSSRDSVPAFRHFAKLCSNLFQKLKIHTGRVRWCLISWANEAFPLRSHPIAHILPGVFLSTAPKSSFWICNQHVIRCITWNVRKSSHGKTKHVSSSGLKESAAAKASHAAARKIMNNYEKSCKN